MKPSIWSTLCSGLSSETASRNLHASAQPSLAVLRPKFWGPLCALPLLLPTTAPESLIQCFVFFPFWGLLPHFGGAHPLTTNRGAVKERAFITGAVNFAPLLLHLALWLGVAL